MDHLPDSPVVVEVHLGWVEEVQAQALRVHQLPRVRHLRARYAEKQLVMQSERRAVSKRKWNGQYFFS
jgi:hypothetical protein